jgi:hypothetical protein
MRSVPFALAALALLALPSRPAAQQPALDSVQESQVDRVPSPANPGAVIFSRDRELMHPGDPLVVVGLEQGDNSFRDQAPALFASDREALLVDRDENYRRHLAMYEEAATFRAALPPADATAVRHPAPGAPVHGLAADPGQPAVRQTWLWIPAGVVIGLLLGFWYRHRQDARTVRR